MQIRETRRLVVNDVVVSPDDVRVLAQIVSDAATNLGDNRHLYLSLHAFDSSEYEGTSLELFQVDGLLDTRQIREIGIYATNRAMDAEIHVRLCHETDGFPRSEIKVVGYDSTWVNGVMARPEHAVDEWQEQASWPRKLRWAFIVLGAFAIGSLYGWGVEFSLDHLVHIKPITPRPSWAEALLPFAPLIRIAVDFPAGLAPSFFLVNKLSRLWPRVELRTGREYAQTVSRQRKYAWAVFSLIVLPVLVSLLYDAVKLVYAH